MKAALLTLALAVGFVAGADPPEKGTQVDTTKLKKGVVELDQMAENFGVKPLTREQKKAAEALQGVWMRVDADPKKLCLVIHGQAFGVMYDGEPRGGGFLRRFDATKTPAEIDLDWLADERVRLLVCGIYKVEGKTLTLALGQEYGDAAGEKGSNRPTAFKGGDKVLLVVLKKVE